MIFNLEIQDPLSVELDNNIAEQDQRLLQVDKDIKEVETNLNRLKKLFPAINIFCQILIHF